MKYRILLLVIFFLIGCRANYPKPMNGDTREALFNRVYLYLMYEYNNTPDSQQSYISRLPIRGIYQKGRHKARIKNIQDAYGSFNIQLVDMTTTMAVVIIKSNNTEEFNWGYFGGEMQAHQWNLRDGEWIYQGNPMPLLGME